MAKNAPLFFVVTFLAIMLFAPLLKAEKLPGDDLTAGDAISQSETVFIGQILQLGSPVPRSTPDHSLYSGVQAKVLKVLKGSVQSPVSLELFVDTMTPEAPPSPDISS